MTRNRILIAAGGRLSRAKTSTISSCSLAGRVLSIAVIMTLAMPVAVSAQTPPTTAAQSRGLTVFPPNVQLDGTLGETIPQTIGVENSSTIDQHVTMSVRNFKPQNEDGQAAPTEESSTFSMARWMTVSPPSFDLKAGERRDVQATIVVPKDAEAGSHFGSVIFTPVVPSAASGPFRTMTEVASLILLRLPGATDEAASVPSFDANVAGNNQGPVEFVTRIKNDGSVHFNPSGKITITDTFGNEVASIPVNDASHPVLPDAIRKFETRWDTGKLQGFYKAKLHLTYASNVAGAPDKVLTAETSFSSFPISLIGAVAGTIGFGGAFVFWAIRRLRQRLKAR